MLGVNSLKPRHYLAENVVPLRLQGEATADRPLGPLADSITLAYLHDPPVALGSEQWRTTDRLMLLATRTQLEKYRRCAEQDDNEHRHRLEPKTFPGSPSRHLAMQKSRRSRRTRALSVPSGVLRGWLLYRFLRPDRAASQAPDLRPSNLPSEHAAPASIASPPVPASAGPARPASVRATLAAVAPRCPHSPSCPLDPSRCSVPFYWVVSW